MNKISLGKTKKTSQHKEEPILKKVNFWEKTAKISIYLLVFLTPLFFLPWTIDPLGLNKQLLLLFLVFIALFVFILKILISDEFKINLSFLNIPVVIFLLVYGLSTIFSLSPYGSFWGWPLNVSAGFLTLLYFVFLYFLIVNIFTPSTSSGHVKREVFWLLFLLVVSGFLATAFNTFQLFGKFIFPWDFASNVSFNTIGTTNALSIFLAILLPLIVVLSLMTTKMMRWFLSIVGLLMLFNMILINFRSAWLILGGEMAILFIFGMYNLSAKKNQLVLFSTILLAVALFFITLGFSLPGLSQIPSEVSLAYREEIDIAKETLLKSPALGTGPGTFVYNYSKFKSTDINQTIFWNIRFERGASEILDKFIATGILGILSLFFILGAFFWLGFNHLREAIISAKSDSDWLLGLGIFSGFTGVVLSYFLYPSNFTLELVFWVFLASFIALEGKKIKTFKPQSKTKLYFILISSSVLILGFVLFLAGTPKYFAEAKYFSGLRAWEQNNLELAIQNLEKAINLNPTLDIYRRDVSQLYLIKLDETLKQRDLPPETASAQAKNFISLSVNSAKKATELNPENMANWNVSGFIYQSLIGVLDGAEVWALSSYQKAAELEPANPYVFTEIGRIYITKADLTEQETEKATNLKLAAENFEKAISLKNDYAPANFLQAMIYVREGKIKEAIEKLESIKQVAPLDASLAFQLGIIYYNDNQLDKAKKELERAVRLDENYSNARYFLGIIYDKEENKQAAISQFETIEKLNPDNEEIKKILSNLKEGKPALEGISPAQPPIEEKPPERLEK